MTAHHMTWRLAAGRDRPALHLRVQAAFKPRGDVLYVHGATFPSALSLFFRFDDRSWADALNEAGFNAWGFDFAGYGESRAPADMACDAPLAPVGRSGEALSQLRTVVAAMQHEGVRRLHVVAHSWGSIPALRLVSEDVSAQAAPTLASLTLFGPIARRTPVPTDAPATRAAPLGAWRLLTVWEQYRRFIADVPRGQPPVLADRYIEAWSRAWLATDPGSATRVPPAVKVPAGPVADLLQMAAGQALYDASRVTLPVLIVRGEWDSLCNDDDAGRLLGEIASPCKRDLVLPRGTHLMHLEDGRHALHRAVNEFLSEASP